MYEHKRSFYDRLFFGCILALCVTSLGINVWPSRASRNVTAHSADNTPVIVLQSSGAVPEDSGVGFVSSIFSSSTDDQTIYLANALAGDVKQYKEGPQASLSSAPGPMVTGRSGYDVYQDGEAGVVVLDSAGKLSAKFLTYPIASLGILSNGNIVVASPLRNNFLHVYSPEGRLLKSFGAIKNYTMPELDDNQTMFFRRGRVVIDKTDDIYYVFQFIPLLQKYSAAGKLIFERQVRGEAIDIQQKLAERFLNSKAQGSVGGIDVINSAAVDPETGHLWVCMNGSSVTGVVYEYSKQGEKIREYALRINSPPAPKQRITGVRDIALTRSNLYALTTLHQVFIFNIRDESTWNSADSDMTVQDAQCENPQTWPSCPFTCPGLTCSGGQPTATSSNSAPLDCQTALAATLTPGYVVISSSCNTYPPGTAGGGTPPQPPHMRGACKDEVIICRSGQNSTHGITVDCLPPQNACSGGEFALCEPCFGNGDCQGCDPFGYCYGGSSYCYSYSPILVDINGDGYQLTDAAHGVAFDLNGNGRKEHLSWTARGSDDAWLALDRNGNGIIDNGAELFGNFAPQP